MLRSFVISSLLILSFSQIGCQKYEPAKPTEPPPQPKLKPPKPEMEKFVAPEARLLKSTLTEKQRTESHIDLPYYSADKKRDIIVPFFFAEEGFKFMNVHKPVFKKAEGCDVKKIVLESPIDSDDPVFLLDWEADIKEGLYSRYDQKDYLMGAPMHNVGIQFQTPKECQSIDFELEAEFFME